MTPQTQHAPAEAEPEGSRLRRSARATLIYFGLATPKGEEPQPRSPGRELFDSALLTAWFVAFVGDHRGSSAAVLVGAVWLPALLFGAAKAFGGRAVDERLLNHAVVIAVIVGATLWAVPRHAAPWIPAAIAIVLCVFPVAGALRRAAELRRGRAR